MDKNKLKEILDKHKKWLNNEPGGEKANLSYADLHSANLSSADLSSANLRYANLSSADLSSANLSYANLSYANLSYANLSYADLSSANLSYANLRYANLSSADLSSADLSSANLRYADLSSANLRSANLSYADLSSANNLFYPLNCPEYGSFIGWKKALSDETESIVKLQILEDSLRSSATGRKCRCSSAKVLEIQSLDGKEVFQCAESIYNPSFIYRTGEVVSVNNFDPDRWNECAAGIHFYITREEAVRHVL